MGAMRNLDARAAIVLAWTGFALATQRWLPWGDEIRLRFASDVRSYETIALAAPGLPAAHSIPLQHAQRFAVPWVVGTLADVTHLGLHPLFRIVSIALLAATVTVAARTLLLLDVPLPAFAVGIGVLVASAFPFHYLLAAPGMLADGLFILGLAVTLLGFVRPAFGLVVGGLVLAVAARQTAIPVAIVAAVWAAAAPPWPDRRRLRVVVIAATPLAAYAALELVARRFAFPAQEIGTIVGTGGSARGFAEHLGRVAVGILVPVAILAGAAVRTRWLPWGATALAAAVIVQPIVLSPEWTSHNEPRLAGLAGPALAVAVASLLARARLTATETALLCAAIAAASLHRLFTNVGVPSASVWGALGAIAAAGAFAVLAGPRVLTKV